MNPVKIEIQTAAELAALKATQREMKALGLDADRVGRSARNALSAISPYALSLSGITLAVTGAVAAGVNYNATLEQQSVAFRTLLGSVEAAEKRMRELADFAASTPFELPDLVAASRILQSLAGDELAAGEGLKLIGDAAAATGRNFQELAMWAGRLYAGLKSGTPAGEATMRLIEMGAISGDTARKLNALAESGAAMQRPFEVMQETFGRFGGAMDLQAETFKGLWSTLKDTVRSDLGSITEGLTEQIKQLMRAIMEARGVLDPANEIARGAHLDQSRSILTDVGKIDSEEGRLARLEQLRIEFGAAKDRLAELRKIQVEFDAAARIAWGSAAAGGGSVRPMARQLTADEQGEMAGLTARIRVLGSAQKVLESAAGIEQVSQNARVKRELAEMDASKQRIASRSKVLDAEGELERARLDESYRANLLGLEDYQASRERLISEGYQREMQARTKEAETVQDQGARVIKIEEAQGLARVHRDQALFELEQDVRKKREAELEQFGAALNQVAQDEAKAAEEVAAARLKEAQAKQHLLATNLALKGSDWRLSGGERRDQTLETAKAGGMSGGEFGVMENQLGPDPRSFEDSWTAMLARLRTENESFAGHFTDTLGNSISQGVNSLSDAIAGAVFQTSNWREELARIPLLIGQEIVGALIKMGLQWITTRLMASLVEQKAAHSETAAKAPGAMLTSISSWGVAALVGAAAFAAAMAAAGGFAAGGETPGTPTLAWVGEKGPELVVPAHVTSKLNPGQKAALVGGDFAAAGVPPGGRGGPAAPSVTVAPAPVSVAILNNESQVRRFLESTEGRRMIVDAVTGHRVDLGMG